jgi:hypothetical protein
MTKPLASSTIRVLIYIGAAAFAAAADRPISSAPPLLKVTYGEVWAAEPLMYSYSVWPDGEILYAPSPLDYNGVKTRSARTLRTTPEVAVHAVNELLKAGFQALQPEVNRGSATRKNGAVYLEHIILDHSQQVTLEFHFANDDFKIEIDEINTLPWALPVLRKIEKDFGITRLVE